MATTARRRKGSPTALDGAEADGAFLVRDGRILLTPGRRPTDALSPTAYEAMATPPANPSALRGKAPRHPPPPPPRRYASSQHSLPTSSAHMSFHDAHSHLASERSGSQASTKPPSVWMRRLLHALRVTAEVLFALCLLVAVGARASVVSLYYLLVFCYHVVQSFESRGVAVLTLVVSLATCVTHGVFIYLFEHKRATAEAWTRTTAASLIGIYELHTVRDYLATIGVDALVLVAAAVHVFYVLRSASARTNLSQPPPAFGFFEAVDEEAEAATAAHYRRRTQLRWFERITATLLFLTAMSLPAFATGVYYVLLLARLVNWTFFASKVTVASLVYHETSATSKSLFLGPRVATLVVALSILIMTAWYVFQLKDVHSIKRVADIAADVGFCDFRAAHVEWSYYLFATCQFLLLLSSAKLHSLHAALARDRDVFHYDDSDRLQLSPRATVELLGANDRTTSLLQPPSSRIDDVPSVDIQYLLSKQPFLVRAFLQEGGLLLSSAAAIVWCVSYPSYSSLPFIAWAFLSLALYGLSSPPFVIWVLIAYGTCLSITEYVSNLTAAYIGAGYAAYGLKTFDYPFLDLSVHNICLVFIYYSIRTRWQYQDVLREYRRQRDTAQLKLRASDASHISELMNHAATPTHDDDERSTMADLRLQADILSQMKLGWGKILELWVRDAKQVVLTHLDALVLLTIIAVAISTKVSFLQIGYLVLAALLLFFFEHRRRFWRVLLFYALAACLAVFVRNISCVPDTDLDLIGLECYSSTSETWGSLYPTLFSAQLVIIVQLVFQLVIYVANKETIDERLRTMHQSRQNPIYFVSRLAVEVDNVFRAVGVIVCYVALLVVAIQYERGTSRLNTNVVGSVQLIVLFTLLGSHLGGFTSAPRTSLWMKVLWSVTLAVQVTILVCRYVYQFEQVTTYLTAHLFTDDFMAARDFGLENHASSSGLSGVFFYLLPTAIVTALCFWQLTSLMRDVHQYDLFAAGRSRGVDRIRFALEALQQVVILFSTIAVVVVAMWAALDDICFIGALYVLILIAGRPLATSWKSLWFPLFWVSAIALVLKYAIQLDIFRPDDDSSDRPGANTLFRAGDSSDWVGLVRLPERVDPRDAHGASNLWDLLAPQLLVMLMCVLQRVAQYFDSTVSKAKQQETETIDALTARFEENYARHLEEGGGASRRHRTSSVEADDDDDDNVDRTKPDTGDNTDELTGSFVGERAASTAASPPSRRAGGKDTDRASPTARSDHGLKTDDAVALDAPRETDLFACFRDFCIGYADKASVNVVTLLLTISCFVRQDLVSIVSMLLVYTLTYAQPATVCRRWWLLALFLSVVIVGEYAIMLWFPPPLGIEMQDTPPWSFVPKSHQQWFVLSDQHRWGIMADFVVLLSVYMLPDSNRMRGAETAATDPATSATASGSLRLHEVSIVSVRSARKTVRAPMDVTDYEVLTRKHVWFYLQFALLCAWLPLLLVLIFLFGAQQGGLASAPYLIGSVWMLYRLDEAREPTNPWIQYMRKWNWAHLFVDVLLHAPYLKTQFTDCKLGSGGTSSSTAACFSIANVLGIASTGTPYGLIAISTLVSIQCEILLSSSYQDVRRLLQLERNRAPVRREEIVRAFYRQRTAQWFALKKEKSAGIQRLKIIVSKLVHKVEELMDIAMGLHYNLPPMAPPRPEVLEVSQNSVTLAWDPPSNTLHKVRYYRISRQVYPSMTLLGDFGDIVELKGDATQATIQGLRPGTTYQFKVCAVSRMGEGPFSVASDPVATYSLNFDGNTTAGWMKYRREQVPLPRLAFLISWMQPAFLHRYIVMDKRHLVYYKDEEIALKHRSRKRRKKLKTTFQWRDVIALRLSASKVQFDDLSPSLYCFELVVRHEGAKHDAKYIFQPDLAKDFNKFLTTLAFAVPLDAVDDSIVACLVEKKLPNPRDPAYQVAPDDTDAFDENASEWSSVTGDESALGDKEDEEFDQSSPRSLLAWRIPVYRMLYKLQNAAFQLETVQYEMDDQYEPSVGELVQVVTNVIRSCTAGICCLAMIICFVCQANLFNMVFVLAAFGFLILESPRPHALAWTYLIRYSYAVIAIEYAFQISIFCLNLSESGYYYPSFQPHCAEATNAGLIEIKAIQPVVLLGLYKFDGSTIDSIASVFGGLQWNFYVLLCMMWHRRELMAQGLWTEANAAAGDGSRMSFQSDTVRALRASHASSRDSIDDAFHQGPATPVAASDPYHSGVARPPPTGPVPPRTGAAAALTHKSSSLGSAEQGHDLAAAFLEEIQAQEDDEERKRADAALAAAAGDDDDDESDGVGTPLSSPPPSGSTTDYHYSLGTTSDRPKTVSFVPNVASEQVEIDDSVDLDFPQRKQLSWWQRTFPRACAYFDAVVCDPPPQWDKDIHIAITGEKPGRDYYTASLSIVLFSAVYAVIFFTAIGEPDASSAATSTADTRLTSSSMLSAYLVLVVLLEVVFLIWDRVAYVCRSLASKLVLQYTYTVLLHVCVWWLIPSHTNIYFQQRPALVFFYLQHCAYLWLGALQIRYGYPAFKGSKYNYSTETIYTKINEKTFGLVMSAPFLFEMRALLDYVCTKTSLSWAHWVLLEDTAAHLFQVKMEMQGRVADAEVLQGKRRQPQLGKLLSAGVMLLFLLICLVGPLALFSSANPSTTENKVTLSDVVFGITDAQGTLSKLYSNSDINSPTLKINKNTDGAAVQRVEFDTFSREIWTSSPPRISQLVAQLQSTEALNWTMAFTFERPGPTDNQQVKISYGVVMTDDHRNDLIPMIKQTVSDTDDDAVNRALPAIRVDAVFPPIVQLTATNGVLRRALTMRSVNVTKHALDGTRWWSLVPFDPTGSTKENYCAETNPFCLVVVSDNIVDGLNSLGIGSYGITAVYIFVVVTIGSAVKGFFRGAYLTVQYDELPDPEDVIELIEGIYIAREENYVGHLKDEVRIFETLIRVLRSPETLVKVTGTNVIYIPTAKEKLD